MPIEGDSHGHLLQPPARLAGEIGFSLSFAELNDRRGGFCDYCANRIVIEERQARPSRGQRLAGHSPQAPINKIAGGGNRRERAPRPAGLRDRPGRAARLDAQDSYVVDHHPKVSDTPDVLATSRRHQRRPLSASR